MKSYRTKWIDYINANEDIDLNKITEKYDPSIKNFITSGMTDEISVTDEINFLQSKIEQNNYAAHKNGYSQLVKLVNGWLCEDVIRELLDEFSAEMNGSDKDRKVDTKPSNDPDLKFVVDEQLCFAEITNINMLGNVHFDESYDRVKNKFTGHRWWQGRSNKYKNLRNYVVNNPDHAYFIINVSDDLKTLLVKRVVKSNTSITPKQKWFDYDESAIALDSEYFVFSCENKSFEEIKNLITSSIKKLIKAH